MDELESLLSGGDRRSLGASQTLLSNINSQKQFDKLFSFLNHQDRLVVMRASDVAEKVTIAKPEYLKKHKAGMIRLGQSAKDAELIWHLAPMFSRVEWTKEEIKDVWKLLAKWLGDSKQSRIVRTFSLQAMYDLSRIHTERELPFTKLVAEVWKENIPSLNARIRKLKL